MSDEETIAQERVDLAAQGEETVASETKKSSPAAQDQGEKISDELRVLIEWAKKKIEEDRKKEEEKKRKEVIERLQRFFPGMNVPEDLETEDLEKVVDAIEKFAKRCNYEPVVSKTPQISIVEAIKTRIWYLLLGGGIILAGAIGYFLR